MKTNALRIEPHRVFPDTKRESFGDKDGTILWKLWIDEELMSQNAHPFAKTDPAIDTHVDPNFPFWGDSGHYTRVRLLENYVIWTDLEIDDLSFGGQSFDPDFYVFDAKEYAQICDAALAETGNLRSS